MVFIDGFGLVRRPADFLEVVSVDLDDVPAKDSNFAASGSSGMMSSVKPSIWILLRSTKTVKLAQAAFSPRA